MFCGFKSVLNGYFIVYKVRFERHYLPVYQIYENYYYARHGVFKNFKFTKKFYLKIIIKIVYM